MLSFFFIFLKIYSKAQSDLTPLVAMEHDIDVLVLASIGQFFSMYRALFIGLSVF